MLSRRALMASTAALVAGCSSIESSFSVPSQPQVVDLTWASESFSGLIEQGYGSRGLRPTLQQIVAALTEDSENPNGPAQGRYTLTPRFIRSQEANPPPRDVEELLAWYGSLEVDLLSVHPFLAQMLGERGVILPLDQFIAADGPEFSEAFYPFLFDHFRSDAGLFALPVDASPTMVQYDPKYFEESGVPPVDSSWDWDDLVENALKLTQRDDDGEVRRWGLVTQHHGNWWTLWQNGADMAEPTTKQCRLQEPAAIEALQFCYDLMHVRRVTPPITSTDGWQVFRSQSGSWPAMYYTSNDGSWSSEYRWAALPQGKVHSVPVMADMGIAITAQAKNTEAAYTALKGLLDVMQRFVNVPAQKEAVARMGDFRKTLLPAEIAAFQQSMEHGRAIPLKATMWRAMFAIEEGLARGDDVVTIVNQACSLVEA